MEKIEVPSDQDITRGTESDKRLTPVLKPSGKKFQKEIS